MLLSHQVFCDTHQKGEIGARDRERVRLRARVGKTALSGSAPQTADGLVSPCETKRNRDARIGAVLTASALCSTLVDVEFYSLCAEPLSFVLDGFLSRGCVDQSVARRSLRWV